MWRLLSAAGVVLVFTCAAHATQWWTSWNGDAYPETQGWTRYSSDPPAQRWLENGSLFIDSRADWFIYEEYSQARPGFMTLGPGETFIMRWTEKTDEVIPSDSADPGVRIASDDQYEVAFDLGVDRIESVYEPGNWTTLDPGIFHEFEFRSSDMRTYVLLVDNAPALAGTFVDSLFYNPSVGWGDVTSHRSLSEWEHAECGIVPEPSASASMLAVLFVRWPLKRSAASVSRQR